MKEQAKKPSSFNSQNSNQNLNPFEPRPFESKDQPVFSSIRDSWQPPSFSVTPVQGKEDSELNDHSVKSNYPLKLNNLANISVYAPGAKIPAPIQAKLNYPITAKQEQETKDQQGQENSRETQIHLKSITGESKIQPAFTQGLIIQRKGQVDAQKVSNAIKALRKAMEGWGTDEDAIFRTLEDKTPEELAEIEDKYLQEVGRTLSYDLNDELSGKDLKRALSSMSKASRKVTEITGDKETTDTAKSDEIVKAADALYKAMEGWGTDEKTIMNTLRGKSKAQIEAIKKVYLDHYGKSLEYDLKDELSGKDLEEALTYLEADNVKSAAKGLEQSLSWINDDEEQIEQILMDLSVDEIKKLNVEHKATLDKVLKSLGGLDKELIQALLIPDKAKAIAIGLYRAIKGMGTDETAVQNYLKKAHELGVFDTVKAEYKTKAKVTLEESIEDEFSDSSIFGAEKTVAKSYLENDPSKQAAARIYNAAYGVGTNEEAIYNEFKGKSQEERDKIKAAYDQQYGKGSFDAMIKDEFSGTELEKVEQYSSKGELDPAWALVDAMIGIGTAEAQIKEVLEGKSKAEIAQIKLEYTKAVAEKHKQNKANGVLGLFALTGDLSKDLESELSGRDWFEAKIALGGKPENVKEKWELIKLLYDYEIGTGSNWFSRAVMEAAQQMGLTTSKLQLEKQYWRLTEVVNDDGSFKNGYGEEDFDRLYNYTETDTKNYAEAKTAIADAIVTGVNITAGIVATVLSAGAASPWLIAAICTGVGGAIGIAIKKGIEGSAYGMEEFGVDLVKVALATALAGVAADGTALAGKLDEITKVFGTGVLKEVVKEFIKGASIAAITNITEQFLTNDKFRDSWLDFLTDLAKKGVLKAVVENLIAMPVTALSKYGEKAGEFLSGKLGISSEKATELLKQLGGLAVGKPAEKVASYPTDYANTALGTA